MQEGIIEKFLRSEVRRYGGECLKFVSPGTSGVPDRIVFMPGGVIRLVETKSPGEKPRATQNVIHRRLAALGVPVTVIDSKAAVGEFIREVANSEV